MPTSRCALRLGLGVPAPCTLRPNPDDQPGEHQMSYDEERARDDQRVVEHELNAVAMSRDDPGEPAAQREADAHDRDGDRRSGDHPARERTANRGGIRGFLGH